MPGQNGESVVKREYDAAGRLWKTYNPYCSPSETASEATTTTYDVLGRVLSVQTPDGAAVTTAYTGNATTVTEPGGAKRRTETDGLRPG